MQGSPGKNTDTNKERSCGSANGEELPKRAPSQFTKIEKETKKSIRLQSLLGERVFFPTGNLHAKETNPQGPVSAY